MYITLTLNNVGPNMKIKVCAILASQQGVDVLKEAHPDIELHLVAVDNTLDEGGNIIPGIGDAGDRLYGCEEASSTRERGSAVKRLRSK